LAPAGPVKADLVEALIARLNDEKYAQREKAMKELEKLDARVRPFLVKALESKLDGESAKRVQKLLDLMNGPVRDPDKLRGQRAVEVLERIGTPAALEVLDYWARGAPGARLTQSAQEASARVRARLKTASR